MANQKPIMYQDRRMWEKVERQLVDGLWQIKQHGQVSLFNFSLIFPNMGALVFYRQSHNQLEIIQKSMQPREFDMVLFNYPYRTQRFSEEGWYVWCLRDKKDYSTVKRPTLQPQLLMFTTLLGILISLLGSILMIKNYFPRFHNQLT